MPWVYRRRPGDGLFTAGEMCDVVVELAVGREGTDVEFIDRISHAVSLVRGAVTVTGIGRFRHPDTEVAHWDHPRNQLLRGDSALAFGHGAERKGLPGALHGAVVEGFKFSCPELHQVVFGIGISPGNANGIDRDLAAQINHYPLGVQRVIFASKGFGEIGITLPIRFHVAVSKP